MIKKSSFYRTELMLEKLRKEKIDSLEEVVESLNGLADEWRKEKLARGENSTKDISLGYNEMIVSIFRGWMESEKELLELEGKVRKLGIPTAKTFPKKKRMR